MRRHILRRLVPALAILTPVMFALAVRSGEAKVTPIEITWHGHSFFTIKSSNGKVIAIDPHAIQQYGRLMGAKADIILVSHNHTDHNQIEVFENVDKKAIEDKTVRIISGLKGGGLKADWNIVDEKIKDKDQEIRIRTVGAYHDGLEGMRFGKVGIFIIEVDGWKICHLGDLAHTLSPAQLKKIGPVDVLMVPVGGIYALNGSEAREVVAQIKPKEYIFPMHYGTKVFDDLLPLKEFLEEQDNKKVIRNYEDNKITINRGPKSERPLIVELAYAPKEKEKEKEKDKKKSK